MKTIRYNTFETNSSSMHALCLTTRYYSFSKQKELEEKEEKNLVIDPTTVCLSIRQFVKIASAEDKAAVYWQHIIKWIDNKLINDEKTYDSTTKSYLITRKITQEDIELNEKTISFVSFLRDIIKSLIKEDSDINLIFKDDIKISRPGDEKPALFNPDEKIVCDYYQIECENSDSTHYEIFKNLNIEEFLERLYNLYINKNTYSDADFQARMDFINNLIISSFNHWILSPSMILQGSDEMSNSERKKQKAELKKFFKQEDTKCNIIWAY